VPAIVVRAGGNRAAGVGAAAGQFVLVIEIN
jgi:hypothetical protein